MGEGPGGRSGFGEAFCGFYEACSPLPMGEGPGVRSGFGWVSVLVCDGEGASCVRSEEIASRMGSTQVEPIATRARRIRRRRKAEPQKKIQWM